MSRRYVLIGVEGNHDQAFLGKVLRELLGFNEWDKKSELDPLWRSNFVPTYPAKGDYYKRLDMPSILHRDDLSIAIYAGEGKDNLKDNLSLKFSDLDTDNFSAFAIVADADKETPKESVQSYCKKFREYFPNFPDQAGTVVAGSPNLGIYILPNNSDQGVLDTLLCECGEVVYPIHMQRAKDYINQFSSQETKHWKPFDREKATIAVVASVLKPGKTNTVTIKDNKWISITTAQQIPAIQSFVDFLRDLIEIKVSDSTD